MNSNKFVALKLKNKVLVGIAIPLIFLLILAGVAFYSINQITYTNKWVNHTHKVLGKSSDILANAIDIETGMRGFLLAGKEEFLEPYNSGEKAVYEMINELKKTVSDNPKQVKRLGEIESVLKEWQSKVTTSMIQLRRDINQVKTMDHMADLVGEARGKQYFDKFRGQIATFKEREEILLIERQERFQESLNSGTASQASIENNMKWVNHTYKVLSEADAILAAAVDMETGMRGFLLAGKENFLEPYNSGRERLYKKISIMKTTVSDNPPQVELMEQIEQNLREWQKNVTEPTINLRRDINKNKKMFHMADLVGEARGKQYFDKFRELLKSFQDEETRLIEIRQDSNETTVTTTYSTIIICCVVSLLLGIFLANLIGNGISKPITLMTSNMSRLSKGDTSIKIEGLDRGDEVGDMAHALEVFKQNRITSDKLEKEKAQEQLIKQKRSERVDSLIKQFEEKSSQSVGAVAATAKQLSQTVEQVNVLMDQASEAAQNGVTGASQTTANVQSVATAVEEMSTTVKEIASNVQNSNDLVEQSV